jgi:multisubunit Na+/H+ antiporter MnhF subunit
MIDAWILAVICLAVLMVLATVRLIAAMILFGVVFKEIIFVDVAIVYGLLSFVSTLYIAKYIGGEL